MGNFDLGGGYLTDRRPVKRSQAVGAAGANLDIHSGRHGFAILVPIHDRFQCELLDGSQSLFAASR